MIRKQKNSKTNTVRITFVLPGAHPHVPASVVGDFNDWDETANQLKKRSNGTYSAAVSLPTGGRYRFRYVSGGDFWFNDPQADAYEPGEFGQDNGIVVT